MATILGLDISSATIGAALIEPNDDGFKLKYHEYFKPPKKVSLFESLYETRQWIIEKMLAWAPSEVVMEDIAKHFTSAGGMGKSSAATMIKLAVYNRTVGLAVYENLNRDPHLINVHTVRSIVKPGGYKGRLSKDDVPEAVAAILKIDFPYKLKKTGKIAEESYDVADAIAVALAFGALEKAKKADIQE